MTNKEKLSGIVLAILLFLVTLSSTMYFLGTLHIGVVQWIAFNSCAPTSLLYLCLFCWFISKKRSVVLPITFLPIYFLGTISMFTLPWSKGFIAAHIGHIIMTLNLIWVLYVMIKHKFYKSLAIGLLISIILFVPYIGYVLSYNQNHAAEIAKLFHQ